MDAGILAIILNALPWLGWAIYRVFRGGEKIGEKITNIQQLREEIQGLNKAISIRNDLEDERYHEFSKLRLKIAKELGINGDY